VPRCPEAIRLRIVPDLLTAGQDVFDDARLTFNLVPM
jgi:hypothetical protein